MFVLIKKLIRTVNEENHTKIDERMLKMAESFVNREYIIVKQGDENDLSPPIAFLFK